MMQDSKVADLASSWLSGDGEKRVTLKEPEIVWSVILEILNRDLSDTQLTLLGADLWSSFLLFHGPDFIGRVELEARANPRFHALLGKTWRGDLPEDIWQRITAIHPVSDHEKVASLASLWAREEIVTKGGLLGEECIEEPEIAWRAILKVLAYDLTEEQEALIAAGPMEDLLVHHGENFVDRVEREALKNPRFNHLLGGVWRQGMPDEIWDRIVRARKEVW